MSVETVSIPFFTSRTQRPPPAPAADLVANVVSLLRRLGPERAQAIAQAGVRMLVPESGCGHIDTAMNLAGLSDDERLSIKIWLLDFVGLQAENLPGQQRDAYEAQARTNISARLGR